MKNGIRAKVGEPLALGGREIDVLTPVELISWGKSATGEIVGRVRPHIYRNGEYRIIEESEDIQWKRKSQKTTEES